MLSAVLEHTDEAAVLIMAAAVADYRPHDIAAQKIKKADDDLTLPLTPTNDILMAVKKQRESTGYPMIVVGFAAESERLVEKRQRQTATQGHGSVNRQRYHRRGRRFRSG